MGEGEEDKGVAGSEQCVCTSNEMKSKGKKSTSIGAIQCVYELSFCLNAASKAKNSIELTSCCLVTESQAGAPTRTDNYTHNVITINREFCSCLSVEIQCVMALIRVLRLSLSACVCVSVSVCVFVCDWVGGSTIVKGGDCADVASGVRPTEIGNYLFIDCSYAPCVNVWKYFKLFVAIHTRAHCSE